MRQILVVPLMVVFLLIGACNAASNAPSPLPSPVDSPLPTAIPLPSITPTPTPWPTNTPTLVSTPTPTPVGVGPPPGLIYKTDFGLWWTDSAGQSVQLLAFDAQHASFVLSKDAEQALYWDWNEGDIWLADLRTGERRNLTNTPTRRECCPIWWTNDPDTILFASQSLADQPFGATLLMSINLSTGQLSVLDASGGFMPPVAASPDGRVLALSRNAQAYVYQENQGLQPFPVLDYGFPVRKAYSIGGPSWSPNGQRLAWIVNGSFDGKDQTGVGVFDLTAHSWQLYHPYVPIGRGGFGFSTATWSPDGKWLAFQVNTRDEGGHEVAGIYVAPLAGESEGHQFGLGSIAWRPDSRQLVVGRSLIEIGTWHSHPIALPPDAEVIDWVDRSK